MDKLTKGGSAFSSPTADKRAAGSSEPNAESDLGRPFRSGAKEVSDGELLQHRLGIRKRSRSVSRVPLFSRLLGLSKATGALVAVGILLLSIVAFRSIICLKRTAVGGKGNGQGIFSRGTSRRLADGETPSDGHHRAFSLEGLGECIADVESASDEESASLAPSSSAEAEVPGQGTGGDRTGRPSIVTRAFGLLQSRSFLALLVLCKAILVSVYLFFPDAFVPAVAIVSATVGYIAGSAGDNPGGSEEERRVFSRLVTSPRFKGWLTSLVVILAVTSVVAPSMFSIMLPLVSTGVASSLWMGDIEDIPTSDDSAPKESEAGSTAPEEGEGASDSAPAVAGEEGVRRRRERRSSNDADRE
ncbi:hypothetical protein CSUI_001384 [Cystoisospora suis]|uniref:Transmembrane protein n=1 Tax=Cystoisospora suis TaxID=483139 RepID=A0A2C6LCM3_9APIC|nr:hypothetical protein CSUI_001384 [Cystoisospora suis]